MKLSLFSKLNMQINKVKKNKKFIQSHKYQYAISKFNDFLNFLDKEFVTNLDILSEYSIVTTQCYHKIFFLKKLLFIENIKIN